MPNKLLETVKELELIGWSEAGAKSYTELINKDDLNILSLNRLVIIVLLVLLFILIYIFTRKYLINNKKKKLPKDPIISRQNIRYSSSKTKEVSDFNTVKKEKADVALKENKQSKESEKSEANKNLTLKSPLSFNFNKAIKDKKPLKDHLTSIIKETSIDIDKSIEPIILICIIIYDISIELIKISSNLLIKNQPKILSPSKEEFIPNELNNRSEVELRNLLEGIDLVNSLNRKQLIKLIISNPIALKKLAVEERKAELMCKTNLELKSLLKGVSNISRLKKKELVQKILSLENKLNI